jgi:hypothetical protein
LETVTLAGAEEAVVADFLESFGQDVLQETADEFLSGQSAGFPVAAGAVAVAEGDLTVLEFENAVVGEGDAKDVGGQILEGGLARADRLAVDDPFLKPDASRRLVKQARLLQGGAELTPKQTGERLDPDEEGVAGGPPALSVNRQPPARDEIMNVGMITQVTGPGLQDAQAANLTANKARIKGQLL